MLQLFYYSDRPSLVVTIANFTKQNIMIFGSSGTYIRQFDIYLIKNFLLKNYKIGSRNILSVKASK